MKRIFDQKTLFVHRYWSSLSKLPARGALYSSNTIVVNINITQHSEQNTSAWCLFFVVWCLWHVMVHYRGGRYGMTLHILYFSAGLGFAMLSVSILIALSYQIILSWSLYYFISSMTTSFPWDSCNNAWNDARYTEKAALIQEHTPLSDNIVFIEIRIPITWRRLIFKIKSPKLILVLVPSRWPEMLKNDFQLSA